MVNIHSVGPETTTKNYKMIAAARATKKLRTEHNETTTKNYKKTITITA